MANAKLTPCRYVAACLLRPKCEQIVSNRIDSVPAQYGRINQCSDYASHSIHYSLLKVTVSRQIRFVGHIMRKKQLKAIALTGKIEGKRAKGKQRKTFMDWT